MQARKHTHANQMLRQANLYCTKGRLAILKVLIRARRPLRQDQIAQRLGPERFDRVTIYRTLSSLVKAGLVHKAFIDERACYFELADNCTETQCHPHFTCTSCGVTRCLTEMSLPMPKRPPGGFLIHRRQTRFEGLCPACA